jgi:hypothetical protein
MRLWPAPETTSDELDAGDSYKHKSGQECERDQYAGKRIAESKEPIQAFPAPDRLKKQEARKRVQRAPSHRGASVAPAATWTCVWSLQLRIPGLDCRRRDQTWRASALETNIQGDWRLVSRRHSQ